MFIEQESYLLPCFTLYPDRGDSVKKNLAQRVRAGLENKTFYDDARNIKRTLSWPFIVPSDSEDEEEQKVQEDEATAVIQTALFGQRQTKDGSLKPWTYKYSKAAIQVLLGLPEGFPIKHVLDLFTLDGPLRRYMLDNTSNRRAAAVFQNLEERSQGRNRHLYETEAQAAGGLMEILDSPIIHKRCGINLNWEQAIKEGWHVYLDLSNVDARYARCLAIFAYTAAIHAARKLKGKYHAVIILEEAGSLDLVTPIILSALQQDRKNGISVYICSQTVNDFLDQTVLETIIGLTDHYLFRSNSGLDRMSDLLVDMAFDTHAVLQQRERALFDGYENVTRTTSSHSKSKSHLHGHTLSENHNASDSSSEAHRTKYRKVIDSEFKTPQVQKQEFKVKIATLETFHYWKHNASGIEKRSAYPLKYPWAFSTDRRGNLTPLYLNRLKEAIERIQSRPLYNPPVWNPPSETTSEPLSLPLSRPTPIITPVTPKGVRGMRRS